MKLKIVFDVDDVIVDFTRMVCLAASQRFGKEFPFEDVSWGFTTWEPEETKYAKKLFNDPEFYKKVPIIEGMIPVIKETVKRGHEVFFCTSVWSDVSTLRFNFLMEAFPEVSPKNIIITGRKDLVECDILFDDCPTHFINTRARIPVAATSPWNKDINNVIRVSCPDDYLTVIGLAEDGYSKSDILEVQQPTYVGKKPCCIVIVGASGSGKTTVLEKLIETHPLYFGKVISDTTRLPRPGEENGVNYFFRTKEEFEERRKQGMYLESSMYAGMWYGSSKESVGKVLSDGKNAVFIMDINGANAVRQMMPDQSVAIYLERDKSELIAAILERDVPCSEKNNRILQLQKDFESERYCDYKVRNDQSVEDAVEKIVDLVL